MSNVIPAVESVFALSLYFRKFLIYSHTREISGRETPVRFSRPAIYASNTVAVSSKSSLERNTYKPFYSLPVVLWSLL